MFGIGPMELIVIAVVAILFIGPKKLPQVMRQIGRFVVHARRHTEDFRSGFQTVMRDAENEIRNEEITKLREQLRDAKPLQSIANIADTNHTSSSAATGQSPNQTKSDHDDYHDPHHDAGDDFVKYEDLVKNREERLANEQTASATEDPSSKPLSEKDSPSK